LTQIIKTTDYASQVSSLSKQKPIEEILGEIIGDKWYDYRKRWKNASSRKAETDFPLFVLFEDQYACNLTCKMCVHGHKDLEKIYSYNGKLDFSTFKSLIDECVEHNCPSICMNNGNEPLLERDIFDRIRYASDKGIIDIHMNTNATLLDKEKSEMLLESGLTRLLIGFDGFTKEEYEIVRKGAHYESVIENIDYFLKLKKKLKKRLPVVRISLVLMKDNSNHLEDFIGYWLDRVDYVAIQNFLNFDSNYSKSIRLKKAINETSKKICTIPWERVVVTGDGEVLPCCSQIGRPLSVGNIHKSSIYDIWNSSQIKNLRKKLMKKEFKDLPVCAECLGIAN